MGCILGLHDGPYFGGGLCSKLYFGVNLRNKSVF